MKLKKCNAVISLVTVGFFLLHSVYQTISYAAFYYNPVLSRIFAYPLAGCMCLHGVLACISVFGKHDSGKVMYPKLNAKTMIQRISAAIAVVLLFFHVFSMSILGRTAGTFLFGAEEAIQLVFIGAMFLHVSVSFSKALITLGILTDEKKCKAVDVVCMILCAVLYCIMSFVIVFVHLQLFAGH